MRRTGGLTYDMPSGQSEAIHDLIRRAHSRPHRLCLTHNDLAPQNILVGEDYNITGIVDWEAAAWMPEYWELTKGTVMPPFSIGRWPRIITAAFPMYALEQEAERLILEHRVLLLICNFFPTCLARSPIVSSRAPAPEVEATTCNNVSASSQSWGGNSCRPASATQYVAVSLGVEVTRCHLWATVRVSLVAGPWTLGPHSSPPRPSTGRRLSLLTQPSSLQVTRFTMPANTPAPTTPQKVLSAIHNLPKRMRSATLRTQASSTRAAGKENVPPGEQTSSRNGGAPPVPPPRPPVPRGRPAPLLPRTSGPTNASASGLDSPNISSPPPPPTTTTGDDSAWAPRNGRMIIKIWVPSTDDVWKLRVAEDVSLEQFRARVAAKVGFDVVFSENTSGLLRTVADEETFRRWVAARVVKGKNTHLTALRLVLQ
ncbi:hypothetical protein C8Q74DRAFT_1032705 [Fomes fomentarius]|nr:hypothetical protein C8Q74DRAFT_1032705 [Fomes fomentarius]